MKPEPAAPPDPTVAPSPVSPTLRQTAVTSVLWTFVERFGSRVLTTVVIIVLGRLLSPSDFGIVAVAAVAVNVLTMVADLGLQIAIERHPAPTATHFHTAFWLVTAVSLTTSGVIFAAAPLIVSLFHQPEAVGPLRALSISPVFYVLYSNQQAILRREVRFRLLARRKVATAVASSVLAIALAFLGFGPYALVAQQVGFNALFAVALWTASSYRPAWAFSWSMARELLGFSTAIAVSNVLWVLEQNVDNAVVGRVLPSSQLGYYTMAYRARSTLTMTLFSAVTTVAVPMMGHIQSDVARLRRAVVTMLETACTVIVPVLVIAAMTAPAFVMLALGDQWIPAITPIVLLALAGIPQVFRMPDAALVASGASRAVLMLQVGSVTSKVVGFVVGVRWGIDGVAASILVTNALWSPVPLLVLKRRIGLPLLAAYRPLVAPLASAGIAAAAMAALRTALASAPLALQVIAIALGGLVSYLACMAVVARPRLRAVWRMVQVRRRRPT